MSAEAVKRSTSNVHNLARCGTRFSANDTIAANTLTSQLHTQHPPNRPKGDDGVGNPLPARGGRWGGSPLGHVYSIRFAAFFSGVNTVLFLVVAGGKQVSGVRVAPDCNNEETEETTIRLKCTLGHPTNGCSVCGKHETNRPMRTHPPRCMGTKPDRGGKERS